MLKGKSTNSCMHAARTYHDNIQGRSRSICLYRLISRCIDILVFSNLADLALGGHTITSSSSGSLTNNVGASLPNSTTTWSEKRTMPGKNVVAYFENPLLVSVHDLK